MKIESLQVEDFRNIQKMGLIPCEGANIIYGDNAQGKTNILEAVWLFSGSRSFRGARDSDYLPFGGERAALHLAFEADSHSQTAELIYFRDKKTVRLNEAKQDRVSSLAGIFCTVVFSPDHLSLIKDGPEKRRRMVDLSLCQAYPKYGKVLESFEKTLRQRNRLLKDIPQHASLVDTLDIWDYSLLEYGAYITRMRARYVQKLAEFAGTIYSGISLGKETFQARYQPSFGGDIAGFEKNDFKGALDQAIRTSRAADIRLGTTTIGPHRDDIEIQISGINARSFGSQGQQRSCVLALKLAECEILQRRCGEPPVVLLDDVMSELDEGRRSYLLNQLQGRQVLITCCDASAYDGLRDGKIFRIQSGELMEESKSH